MADQSLKETPKTQSNPQTQVQGQNQQPKQKTVKLIIKRQDNSCLLYTSPSPRD